MRQINIFGEVEYVDKDGKIKRCEWCNKPCPKFTNCCSDECAKKSLENVLGSFVD